MLIAKIECISTKEPSLDKKKQSLKDVSIDFYSYAIQDRMQETAINIYQASVATEWYVVDNLECAEDYLRIHATLITKRMTEEADDETLAMYLNLGLLSDKDLQRTLQWASEKNMPVSVAYILDQMRKRGLKAKTELAL